MKIRITDNLHPNTTADLNFNDYIGKEFFVHSKGQTEGSLNVDFGLIRTVTIYKGEYQIIEVRDDLDNYFRNYQRKYNFCNDDVVDFLIEHRDEIVNILR